MIKNNKKVNRIGKKLLCGLLSAVLTLTATSFGGTVFTGTSVGVEEVYAVASSEKSQKKATENKLDKAQDKLSDLQDEKSAVNAKISKKKKEIQELESDISALKKRISSKQKEIDKANDDLEIAEAKEEEEYEAMKVRIQYMYENSTADSMWTAILEADGITDMLNRLEYISEVYEKDRELLTAYQETILEVEELQEKLTAQMEDLCEDQDNLESKMASAESKLKELQKESANYSSEISSLKSTISSYKDTIASLGKTIQKAEEAAARAAAQRAAAAAEARRRQQAAAAAASSSNRNNSSSSSNRNNSSSSSSSSSSSKKDKNANNSAIAGDKDPAGTTGVSGSDVVAYALKFVGNKYVWGGNSLTNGTDCSGFVHLVYAHFGISTPRYSQAFLNQGKTVSLSNIKAGDVVVYPGHVAIAIGNGKIVEAQGKKWGITCSRSVTCNTIRGIRRYV